MRLPSISGPLHPVLRHDRAPVLASLGIVAALAWLWLLLGGGLPMPDMDMGNGQRMLMAAIWSPGYAGLILAMWAIMMVAMMLPSAAPAILLVDALARRQAEHAAPLRAGAFAAGYLIVWFAFSIVATGMQWMLSSTGLLSGSMAATSRFLAGTLLIAAGAYQWTPLKRACLSHCRSPIEFIGRHWRSSGPVLCGVRHGLFCLGCCWVLMLLLFVGGLMNLLWVAGLAVLVFIEKVLPWGGRIGLPTGAVLIIWGAAVLVVPFSF